MGGSEMAGSWTAGGELGWRMEEIVVIGKKEGDGGKRWGGREGAFWTRGIS